MTLHAHDGDMVDDDDESDVVDLLTIDKEKPVRVKLPNGRRASVQFFSAEDYQLWERVQERKDLADAHVLLQRAIPSLTTAERDALSPAMVWFVVQAAARKATMMLSVLRGNGGGPPTSSAGRPRTPGPSARTRSPRSTSTPTTAAASGESAAASSTPSPASRTT